VTVGKGQIRHEVWLAEQWRLGKVCVHCGSVGQLEPATPEERAAGRQLRLDLGNLSGDECPICFAPVRDDGIAIRYIGVGK
jgi:hypothetical protein